MEEYELDEIIRHALEQGRDVGIELDDDYGWHVTVDEVRITDGEGDGAPWEQLEIMMTSYYLSDESNSKIREIEMVKELEEKHERDQTEFLNEVYADLQVCYDLRNSLRPEVRETVETIAEQNEGESFGTIAADLIHQLDDYGYIPHSANY